MVLLCIQLFWKKCEYFVLQIKKFNLELVLFQKDLDSYIQNSNETDNETTKLMNTIILGLDRLQHNSKFRDQHTFNENQFAHDLNDEIFERRRIIVCRLCSVSRQNKMVYCNFYVV